MGLVRNVSHNIVWCFLLPRAAVLTVGVFILSLDGLVLKDLPDRHTKGCLTAQGSQRGPG